MTWTTGVLSLVLPPDEAETVSGDLIEEYREAIQPAFGRWRADLWLVFEVAGFVWRALFVWSVLVAAFMAGRFALDTFAPPQTYGPRSFFTTWSAILLYLAAGAWTARRTGQARSGAVVATAAHLVGHAMSVAVTAVLFMGVIRYEPARRVLFEQTGGWGEQWFLPLILAPIACLLGAVGGACGRSFAKRSRA